MVNGVAHNIKEKQLWVDQDQEGRKDQAVVRQR